MPPKTTLVKPWVFGSYLQICGSGVTCRNRADSKGVVSAKAHSNTSETHKNWTLGPIGKLVGNLTGQRFVSSGIHIACIILESGGDLVHLEVSGTF